MNYKCEDMVVYGIHGVCRIAGIETRVVDRRSVEYYVLEPVKQSDAKFYVPTQNPAAVAKMRKMLTAREFDKLLKSSEVKADSWIANETMRKEQYKILIARADCAELISMIRALYFHKQKQIAAGKKFHQCDENFMRDAERVIRSEVSCILGISQDQVGEYIRNKLGE